MEFAITKVLGSHEHNRGRTLSYAHDHLLLEQICCVSNHQGETAVKLAKGIRYICASASGDFKISANNVHTPVSKPGLQDTLIIQMHLKLYNWHEGGDAPSM